MTKTTQYKATIEGNGTEYEFDSMDELKAWASRATMVYQCDLSIKVEEIVATEMRFSASYETGEVEDAA